MNRFRSSLLPRLFSSVTKTEKMFDEAKTSSIFKKLKVGPMKRLYKYYTAESINLAGGLPMESTFPFKDINISIDGVDSFQLSKGKNLFLNYHRGDGLPALKEWVTKHVTDIHHPLSPFESCLTVGSTDAFAKTLNMIDTDCVIFDQYAYGAAVNTCVAFDKKPVGVKTDEYGMIPDALRESVIALREKGMKVNLVYFVPVGQNPTGTTISFQRKQELYKVCQELDILIVEDDAYYYLYFEMDKAELPGVRSLPKSFLSMDTDGRVIRFDSLSKFIAPGARIGWVSAHPDFVQKYILLQEVTTQFPSGFSQSIFLGLVNHWTPDQLHEHTMKIQQHYKSQCAATVDALKNSFAEGDCEYNIPSGGMFLWLTFPKLTVSSFELFRLLADAGVIAVPGDDFLVEGVEEATPPTPSSSEEKKAPTLRVTFAASSPEQIAAAISRMAGCIKALPV